MNTEQERAEFEAWYLENTDVPREAIERKGDRYAWIGTNQAWAIWQAAQAALQSQDREDDPDTIRALRAERDALRDVLDRIVSYYDMLRRDERMPPMTYQAASDHENTMFGQARILLAKEQS